MRRRRRMPASALSTQRRPFAARVRPVHDRRRRALHDRSPVAGLFGFSCSFRRVGRCRPPCCSVFGMSWLMVTVALLVRNRGTGRLRRSGRRHTFETTILLLAIVGADLRTGPAIWRLVLGCFVFRPRRDRRGGMFRSLSHCTPGRRWGCHAGGRSRSDSRVRAHRRSLPPARNRHRRRRRHRLIEISLPEHPGRPGAWPFRAFLSAAGVVAAFVLRQTAASAGRFRRIAESTIVRFASSPGSSRRSSTSSPTRCAARTSSRT